MATPDLTAEGSGYFRTYVDGVEQSQHTTERKAIQAVYELREAHPEAEVTYDHDYLVRVGGQQEPTEPEPEPEPAPEPDERYPHEPELYKPVVAFDGSIVPPHYKTAFGGMEDPPLCGVPALAHGCCVAHQAFTEGPHHVISDPSAPIGPDQLRFVFPEGGTNSPGFVNFWGRSHDQLTALARSRARPDGFELEKMYYSARFRLTSGPGDGLWEIGTFQGSHLKLLGYISAGDRPGAALFPLRIDTVDEPLISSAEPKFMQQGPSSIGERTHWVPTGTVHVDQWHHLELVMELNDIGQANGLLVIYMDGAEQARVETVEYRTAEHPHGFHIVHMNQVWGNGQDARTRTDYMDLDHLYVSGVELAGVNG